VEGEAKIPMKVKLYGSPTRYLRVNKPSAENILPRLTSSSTMRFNSFEVASGLLAVEASPRKRQNLCLDEGTKAAWDKAVSEMVEAAHIQLLEDDELPEVAEVYSYAGLKRTESSKESDFGSSSKVSTKGKAKAAVSEDESDEEISLDPPSEDCMLDYPGELLMAKSRLSEGVYWPAQMIEYIPPKKKGQLGLYKVQFLDLTIKEIPRTFFYTSEQNEFTTCKVGSGCRTSVLTHFHFCRWASSRVLHSTKTKTMNLLLTEAQVQFLKILHLLKTSISDWELGSNSPMSNPYSRRSCITTTSRSATRFKSF